MNWSAFSILLYFLGQGGRGKFSRGYKDEFGVQVKAGDLGMKFCREDGYK